RPARFHAGCTRFNPVPTLTGVLARPDGRHIGMNSKRRSIALLTAGLATLVAVVAGSASAAQDRTTGPQARAATATIRVWTDKDRHAAVDQVVGEWAKTKGLTVEVVEKDFGKIRDDLKTVQPESAPDVII